MNEIKWMAETVAGRVLEADGRPLTPRQMETLYYMVVEGMTNIEIGKVMVVSVKTVEQQLALIRHRLRYETNARLRIDMLRRYCRLEARALEGSAVA